MQNKDKLDYVVLNDLDTQQKGFMLFPNFVLKDNTLSNTAKVLYGILLSYSHEKTYCFPSQNVLCADLSCSKPTLIKYLNELEQSGYIRIETTIVKRGKRNTYHIVEFEKTERYNKIKNIDEKTEDNSKKTIEEVSDKIDKNTPEIKGGYLNPFYYGCLNPFYYGCLNPFYYGCLKDLYYKYIYIKYISIKYINNTLLNNNGVCKQTQSIEKQPNKLFNTKTHEIKYLENQLSKLNKNKQRLKCATLRIKIAKLKDNWDEVTYRDFSYYFSHVMYAEKYNKKMQFDNYFNAAMGKFIKHYDIQKKDVLKVLKQILDNYNLVQTEQYPTVSQLLFSQFWLLDKILLNENNEIQEVVAVENEEEVLDQYKKALQKAKTEGTVEQTFYF